MIAQFQLAFWILSILYIIGGLFFAHRILRALGYIPVERTFAPSTVLLVLAGASVLSTPFQLLTFNIIQFISVLTVEGGMEALAPTVWGNVPLWLHVLLNLALFILLFALTVWFGWGRIPELLAWKGESDTLEEEANGEEEESHIAENSEESPADDEDFSLWEDDEETSVLPFLDQIVLSMGIAYLVYNLLDSVMRLILFVPFLRQPQQTRTNIVGFSSAWVAGLVLFAMVAYLVYNKVAEA